MPHLISRLEREWPAFNRHRATRAFVATLAADPLLAAGTADELVTRIRDTGLTDSWAADDILRALLKATLESRSSVGQHMVLHTLIPGMCGILIRIGAHPNDRDYHTVVDEIVTATAHRIASYPLERRHAGVFHGILRDVERDHRRARQREAKVTPCGHPGGSSGRMWANLATTVDPVMLDNVEHRVDLASAINRAVTSGKLRPRDVDLVVSDRLAHEPFETISRRVGLNPETARRTQLRAESRLGLFLGNYRPTGALAG